MLFQNIRAYLRIRSFLIFVILAAIAFLLSWIYGQENSELRADNKLVTVIPLEVKRIGDFSGDTNNISTFIKQFSGEKNPEIIYSLYDRSPSKKELSPSYSVYLMQLRLLNKKANSGLYKIYSNTVGDVGYPFVIKVGNDDATRNNLHYLSILWANVEKHVDNVDGDDLVSYPFVSEPVLRIFVVMPDKQYDDVGDGGQFTINLSYGLCGAACMIENQKLEIRRNIDGNSFTFFSVGDANGGLQFKHLDKSNSFNSGGNNFLVSENKKELDLVEKRENLASSDGGESAKSISNKVVNIFGSVGSTVVENRFYREGKNFISDKVASMNGEKSRDNSGEKNLGFVDVSPGRITEDEVNSGAVLSVADRVHASGITIAVSDIDSGIWKLVLTLFLAFGGGMILNIMPCVFPVLSIKIMHLIRHKGENREVFCMHIINLIGGMLFFFFLLIVLVAVTHIFNNKVLWGEQFQMPFYTIFVTFFMLITLNSFFGYSKISLPDSVRVFAGQFDIKREYLNSFFSGFLVTLLATPCTAPMLGMALSFTIGKGLAVICGVYLVIALGMIMPYLFLLLFPKLSNFIPKPGRWMKAVERVMSLPLIATILWLLYIIEAQGGRGLLLLSITTLLIAQSMIICHKHGVISHRTYTLGLTFLITLTAFISFFADNLDHLKEEDGGKSSFFSLQKNIPWDQFDTDVLKEKVTQNQTVLLVISAKWCLLCRANENILQKEAVLTAIKKYNVVLMRGDYTRRSEKIKDFILSHKRQGIPLVIVYGPAEQNGIALPEKLSVDDVVSGLKRAKGGEN